MPRDEHMAGSPGARESGVARRPDAGLTCLQGLTRVSLERPVSTSRRSSHAPRCHRVRGVGSPSAAWQAVSRRPSRRAAPCRISLCKGCSTTGAGAHSQATPTLPCLRHSQRVPPPSPRWCARPWRPSGWGLRPARRGEAAHSPRGRCRRAPAGTPGSPSSTRAGSCSDARAGGARGAGAPTPASHAGAPAQTPGGPRLAGPGAAPRCPPHGPEAGRGVCGPGAPLRIDLVDQRGAKIEGGRCASSHGTGLTRPTSVEEPHDHDKKANEYYWF